MLYRSARRVVIAVIGGTLLLIGIAGFLLPILPGWPLFFIGLAVLGTEFVWAKRLLKRAKAAGQSVVDKMMGRKPGPAADSTPECAQAAEVDGLGA